MSMPQLSRRHFGLFALFAIGIFRELLNVPSKLLGEPVAPALPKIETVEESIPRTNVVNSPDCITICGDEDDGDLDGVDDDLDDCDDDDEGDDDVIIGGGRGEALPLSSILILFL